MAPLKWLAFAVFAIVALVFGMLAVNQEAVALRLLDWQTPQVSVFFWLLAAFALGLSAGVVGMMLSGMRHGLERRRLNKVIAQRDKEISALKSVSVPSDT